MMDIDKAIKSLELAIRESQPVNHYELRTVLTEMQRLRSPAPRLEWRTAVRKTPMGHTRSRADAPAGFTVEVVHHETIASQCWVRVRYADDNLFDGLIHNAEFTGPIERGQRIAEMVVHRHRQMLDEIGRML